MVNSDKKRYVKLFLLHPIEIGMRAIWKLNYAITGTAESRNILCQMIMCDLKFKGIPVKRLTKTEMEMMRYDVSVDVEYRTPTAWKTAMKNNVQNPNEFKPRKRRVKRGQSLAELGLLRSDGKLFDVNETQDFLATLFTL